MNLRDERNQEWEPIWHVLKSTCGAVVTQDVKGLMGNRMMSKEHENILQIKYKVIPISPDYPLSLERQGEKCRSIG